MGYSLEYLDYPDWLEALVAKPSRGTDDDVIGSILRGAAPEMHEFWDDNIYDDSNTRRALRGSSLQRPAIDASLFGNYVRYFVNQGWVEAPSGLPREIREGAQHKA